MIISKRLISLILSLVIMTSVVVGLEVSTSAEETEPIQLSEEIAEEVAQLEEDAPTDMTVQTDEGETQVATQAPTEQPTVEPTVDPTKVGKVTKIYKDTKYSDKITFTWDEVEGADGYRIYYKNNDTDTDYRLLTTTSGTSITVRDLPHTTPFQFKIAAYETHFGKVYEGASYVGKTATHPAATNKPTLKKSSSSINISCNKNSRADGYRIYREDSSTKGKLVLYKIIKSNSTTTFEDKKVKSGKAYNYQVRAYREMYPSKKYEGTGSTLRTVAGLCSSKLVSCTSQLRRVSIEWKKNAKAQGYDIYYKADDRDTFKLLKSTKNTYINTKRLRAGHTYYFRIKPYKLVGAKKTKVYGTYLSLNKKVTSTAYGKKIGTSYIEISIKQQHMWYYIDGKLYAETDVVTGNQGAYSTPTGAYKIWQRSSPATLVGPSWCVNVNYWMAFTYGGCGIHDSTWRSASEYGGNTYKGNGSHGCVNTPYSVVKKMYKKAKIGTHVVVY